MSRHWAHPHRSPDHVRAGFGKGPGVKRFNAKAGGRTLGFFPRNQFFPRGTRPLAVPGSLDSLGSKAGDPFRIWSFPVSGFPKGKEKGGENYQPFWGKGIKGGFQTGGGPRAAPGLWGPRHFGFPPPRGQFWGGFWDPKGYTPKGPGVAWGLLGGDFPKTPQRGGPQGGWGTPKEFGVLARPFGRRARGFPLGLGALGTGWVPRGFGDLGRAQVLRGAPGDFPNPFGRGKGPGVSQEGGGGGKRGGIWGGPFFPGPQGGANFWGPPRGGPPNLGKRFLGQGQN